MPSSPLAASYDLTYFWPTASISSDTRIQPTIRSARSSTDFLGWPWNADETLAATHSTNGAAANAERLPHSQGLQLSGSVNPGKLSRWVQVDIKVEQHIRTSGVLFIVTEIVERHLHCGGRSGTTPPAADMIAHRIILHPFRRRPVRPFMPTDIGAQAIATLPKHPSLALPENVTSTPSTVTQHDPGCIA